MGPSRVIGWNVRMVCRRCGNSGERSLEHLERKYGAADLAEVARRARCLRYIKGVRCGGMAEVSWVEAREKHGSCSEEALDPNSALEGARSRHL